MSRMPRTVYTTPTRRTPPRAAKRTPLASPANNYESVARATSTLTSDETNTTSFHPHSRYDSDEDDSTKKQKTIGLISNPIPILSCEESYANSGNSKTVLLAMCRGVEGCNPDINLEPFKSAHNRRAFIPQAHNFSDEIVRRAIAIGLPKVKLPRPKAWKQEKRIEWLEKNKIRNPVDIEFLRKELADFKELLVSANIETITEEELHRGSDSWIGQEPYLRLYHVMIEDHIKEAYLKVYDVLDRTQLDARNSSERPMNFYQLASDLYNDPQYNPYTTAYPNLHSDFSNQIRLLSTDAPFVTASKIKDKLADVRAKLVIIISNWERSGNGGGNRQENDDDFGSPRGFTLTDDDRANFLGGHKPHLLYFWQKMDDENMLQHTRSIIPNHISANSEGVPSTLTTPRDTPCDPKRKLMYGRNEESVSNMAFQNEVKKSFAILAKSSSIAACNSSLQTLSSLQTRFMDLSEQYENAPDGPRKAVLLRMVQDAEMFYEQAKTKYDEAVN
jgi:hypothetical protein